ncbi:MAG: PEP-CTERM sorting domain-containing protein [Bryobacteraceae bacterium]|nr:PEP-CTERM sorting domain-containing protein [Bryobacteraceae bacterium]
MKFNSQVRVVALAGLAALAMATNARAALVTYNTNAAGTGFGGATLTLSNSVGANATLSFVPNGDTSTGVPSNVNFGNFTLVCPSCSTQALSAGSFFSPFTFNIVVTDVTDGAVGQFVGTSTGGTVFSDVSQITINWAPLMIGPGTTNASSGNFGPTTFSTTVFTGIVAPNSGSVPGQSTIQGFVTSADPTATPEPATTALIGSALLAFGMLRRLRANVN